MGVLTDLTNQSLSVACRHRIVRLDLLLGIDSCLKGREEFGRFLGFAVRSDQPLSIHEFGLPWSRRRPHSLANPGDDGKRDRLAAAGARSISWPGGDAALHHEDGSFATILKSPTTPDHSRSLPMRSTPPVQVADTDDAIRPENLLIRPAIPSDLSDFYELARLAGAGFTSLPANEAVLAERLRTSARAFAGEAGTLMLALEDRLQSRVVGCAAVKPGGTPRPDFLNFRITDGGEALSPTDRYADMTEVGSLLLHPDYRSNGIGPFLARSRYLLIATDPRAFWIDQYLFRASWRGRRRRSLPLLRCGVRAAFRLQLRRGGRPLRPWPPGRDQRAAPAGPDRARRPHPGRPRRHGSTPSAPGAGPWTIWRTRDSGSTGSSTFWTGGLPWSPRAGRSGRSGTASRRRSSAGFDIDEDDDGGRLSRRSGCGPGFRCIRVRLSLENGGRALPARDASSRSESRVAPSDVPALSGPAPSASRGGGRRPQRSRRWAAP